MFTKKIALACFLIACLVTMAKAQGNSNILKLSKADGKTWAAEMAEYSKISMKGKPVPDLSHIQIISPSFIKVYPSGFSSVKKTAGVITYTDIANIQWAADNVSPGGTVRLMTKDPDDNTLKTFFFGHINNGKYDKNLDFTNDKYQGITDFIELHQSVKIEGERLAGSGLGKDWKIGDPNNQDFKILGGTIKSDRATIYGGGAASLGVVYCDPNTANVDSEISGIRFDSPLVTALGLHACGSGGTKINDNVITNIIPQLNPFRTAIWTQGIFVGNPWWSSIQGPVIVENNLIQPLGDDPANDPTTNKWISYTPIWLVATNLLASGSVSNNIIKNSPGWGMGFDYCDGSYPITVEGNIVSHRNYSMSQAYPSGMFQDYSNNIHFVNNKIDGAKFVGIGLIAGINFNGDFAGHDNEVLNNIITMEGYEGIDCDQETNDKITNNTISGIGYYGINLYDGANNDTIKVGVNKLNGLTLYPGGYHINLDSSTSNITVNCNGATGLNVNNQGSNTINCP